VAISVPQEFSTSLPDESPALARGDFSAQLWLIARLKLRILLHFIRGLRHESKLKLFVVTTCAILLWLFLYYLFYKSFDFVESEFEDELVVNFEESVSGLLMARLMSLLFLALFFMLIFSNLLVSLSTLFRSDEVRYLFTTPMEIRALYTVRVVESIVFSSTAFLYLGSPLLISFGVVNKVPWHFYVFSLIAYLPFALITAVIGASLILILARIFPTLNRKFLVILAVLALIFFFSHLRTSVSVRGLAGVGAVTKVVDILHGTQSPLLPSFWAARALLESASGNVRGTAYFLGLLTSTAVVLYGLSLLLVTVLYYRSWVTLFGEGRIRARIRGGILQRVDGWLGFLPDAKRALFVKDIRLFWRDATQVSQFVVFFGLMALYIASLRNAPHYIYLEQPSWKNAVAFLNLTAISLILATLTTRFIFPLLSLEGKRFWILGLAPISRRELIMQKFWLSIATTSVFTVGLTFLSAYILRVGPVVTTAAVSTMVMMNFSLAGLSVGLGAIYPNFKEDIPAKIVSGVGGTLNFVFSIVYIGLTVGVLWTALQVQIERSGEPAWSPLVIWAMVIVSVISVLATVLPLWLGTRVLLRTEF